MISTIQSTRELLIAMNEIEQNRMPPEEEEEVEAEEEEEEEEEDKEEEEEKEKEEEVNESFSSTQVEYPDSPEDI